MPMSGYILAAYRYLPIDATSSRRTDDQDGGGATGGPRQRDHGQHAGERTAQRPHSAGLRHADPEPDAAGASPTQPTTVAFTCRWITADALMRGFRLVLDSKRAANVIGYTSVVILQSLRAVLQLAMYRQLCGTCQPCMSCCVVKLRRHHTRHQLQCGLRCPTHACYGAD